MLGKIKKVLGIEGVKLELVMDTEFKKGQTIEGTMKFTTKTASHVESISIQLVERYSRGRGKKKLVDEYPFEQIVKNENFKITPEQIIEIPFTLEYELVKSEMDKIAESNIVSRPIVGLAKFIKNVKSTYFVVAEAKVKGTTLHPFDKKEVKLK